MLDPEIRSAYALISESGDKVAKAIVRYGLEYASVAQADFELFTRAVDEEKGKVE